MLWECTNITLPVPSKKSETIVFPSEAERVQKEERKKKEKRDPGGHVQKKTSSCNMFTAESLREGEDPIHRSIYNFREVILRMFSRRKIGAKCKNSCINEEIRKKDNAIVL